MFPSLFTARGGQKKETRERPSPFGGGISDQTTKTQPPRRFFPSLSRQTQRSGVAHKPDHGHCYLALSRGHHLLMDAATKSSVCPKHATCNPPSCQQRTCTAYRGSFPRVSRSAGGPILPSASKRPNSPPPPRKPCLPPRKVPEADIVSCLAWPRPSSFNLGSHAWGLERPDFGSLGWVAGRGLEETPLSGQEMQKILKIPSSSCHHGPTHNTKKWRPLGSQWKTTRAQPQPALPKLHQVNTAILSAARDTIYHSRRSSPPVPTIRSSAAVLTRCGTPPSKAKRPTPGSSGPPSKIPSRSGSGTMHDRTHPFGVSRFCSPSAAS